MKNRPFRRPRGVRVIALPVKRGADLPLVDRAGLALLLLVALFTLAFALPARAADEVWRLAGTFNNWNTRDSAWQMTPLPDGTWFIRQHLAPGEYQFKFVRNGDWQHGHFGAASGSSTALTEPGDNLQLSVQEGVPVEIVLAPERNAWRRDVPAVSEPVAIATTRGLPRVGLPLRLDLADSLLPRGIGPVRLVEVTPDNPGAIRRLELGAWQPEGPGNQANEPEPRPAPPQPADLDPAVVHIVPLHAGEIGLTVRINAGGFWSKPQRVTLNVRNRVFLEGPYRTPDGLVASRLELHPTDDGQWVTVLRAQSRGFQSLELNDLDRNVTLPVEFSAEASGEIFALTYRPSPARIDVVPGLYRLVEGPSTYTLAEDPLPLPASGVLHDPRRPDHATAISAGLGLVDLTAYTAAEAGDDGVRLSVRVLGRDGLRSADPEVQAVVPMVPVFDPSTGRLNWHARIKTSGLGGDSRRDAGGPQTLNYELVQSHAGQTARRVAGPFRLTVQPEFETPDWAKQAVWYQIFPERFRNGNPANDPHGEFVFPLPWNAEWHTVHDGEFDAWRNRVIAAGADPDRWDRKRTGEPGGRFYNVVWDRRYGGDLQGVMEKLDYLHELGVTAIYLNPVFEGESLHKYDTTDFRHVDDNFGNAGPTPESWSAPDPDVLLDASAWTWTEADEYFLELIDEVHERGMKIIIDGVFNHVGRAHPAFADVLENGQDSEFADWFMCEFDDEGNLVGWVAWDQPDGWLPKFNQKADRDLVDPVKQHIFDITRRWMDPDGDGDPSDGIDGWRLDVPLDVGIPFWLDWYRLVKDINPEAFIAAEIWTEWESEPHLRGDRFDAQMHYPVAREMVNWLVMQPGMTSDELARRLEGIYARYEPQTALVQQNLLESHDTDRIVSNLYNVIPGRPYDAGNRPQQGEPYREDRPDERAYAMSRLALVLQATYVGTPMIFYGQEVGMHGADDPSCRKTRPWPDTPAPENAADRPDYELESFYRAWLNRRASDPVLQLGSVQHLSSGRDDVFAFVRQLNDRAVIVVINKGMRSYPLARLVSDPDAADTMVGPMDAVAVDVDPTAILW